MAQSDGSDAGGLVFFERNFGVAGIIFGSGEIGVKNIFVIIRRESFKTGINSTFGIGENCADDSDANYDRDGDNYG